MKEFIHKETLQKYNLSMINGTDYWSDKDGDLYIVDVYGQICSPVCAKSALQSILRRNNQENGICPVCHKGCLKSNLNDFERKMKKLGLEEIL